MFVTSCHLQLAEGRKAYAEEKEEEVRLLERSVEEFEFTVNTMESKVSLAISTESLGYLGTSIN